VNFTESLFSHLNNQNINSLRKGVILSSFSSIRIASKQRTVLSYNRCSLNFSLEWLKHGSIHILFSQSFGHSEKDFVSGKEKQLKEKN
jgi:hypothetical protein